MKHRLTLMSGTHPMGNNEVGDFNDERTAHLVGGLLLAIDANNAPEYRRYDVAKVTMDNHDRPVRGIAEEIVAQWGLLGADHDRAVEGVALALQHERHRSGVA